MNITYRPVLLLNAELQNRAKSYYIPNNSFLIYKPMLYPGYVEFSTP